MNSSGSCRTALCRSVTLSCLLVPNQHGSHYVPCVAEQQKPVSVCSWECQEDGLHKGWQHFFLAHSDLNKYHNFPLTLKISIPQRTLQHAADLSYRSFRKRENLHCYEITDDRCDK